MVAQFSLLDQQGSFRGRYQQAHGTPPGRRKKGAVYLIIDHHGTHYFSAKVLELPPQAIAQLTARLTNRAQETSSVHLLRKRVPCPPASLPEIDPFLRSDQKGRADDDVCCIVSLLTAQFFALV